MNIKSFFVAASAVCTLAGCGSMDERAYSLLAAYPVGGKPVKAFAPSGKPVPCPAGGSADSCTIPIKVTDPSCDADKIVLEDFVELGDISRKKRITWTLPAGYVFCPRAGDGVFLKDPNVPDDLFDPVNAAGCSPDFVWKRKKSDGKDYEYLIRFRSALKVCGVKDPWARN